MSVLCCDEYDGQSPDAHPESVRLSLHEGDGYVVHLDWDGCGLFDRGRGRCSGAAGILELDGAVILGNDLSHDHHSTDGGDRCGCHDKGQRSQKLRGKILEKSEVQTMREGSTRREFAAADRL